MKIPSLEGIIFLMSEFRFHWIEIGGIIKGIKSPLEYMIDTRSFKRQLSMGILMFEKSLELE